MKYKITAITSIYKGEIFIDSFLENIVKQTQFDNCEWFLLDASNSGAEYKSIKPYIARYKNIRYETIKQDPGIYGCWNYMIENSDSEYIFNANLDDRLFPYFIEKHVKELEKHSECDLVYCANVLTTDLDDLKIFNKSLKEIKLYPNGAFNRKKMITHCYPNCHPMWRRTMHAVNGLFNTEYHSAGDFEFWLRCLAAGGKDFRYINEILGIYYLNPNGLSTNIENNDKKNIEENTVKEIYQNKI